MGCIVDIPIGRAVALSCLMFLGRAASAQTDIELQGGLSVTTGGERTPVVAAGWLPAVRTTPAGVLRMEIGAMRFDGRGGRRGALADDVAVVYVGVRSEHRSGLLWGLGVGAQSGKTDALSGDPQFVSSLGWRWERFSLVVRHVSNGGSHEPNRGETALLAGLRF
jgi:hypothetical protein